MCCACATLLCRVKLFCGECCIVDPGRLAQHTPAPAIAGAALVGEIDQNRNKAESMILRSNREALLAAIRQFFMDNPTWE